MRCWLLILALGACDRTGSGTTGPGDDSASAPDLDHDGWSWPDDCDDADPAVHPDADEICDDRDNDCDGNVDGDDAVDRQTAYVDADGDGHGDPDQPVLVCRLGWGQAATGDDCDDNSSDNHPGNDEACDGLDNDCDVAIDEGLPVTDHYPDLDGDGYGDSAAALQDCAAPSGHVSQGGDCDDTTELAHPDTPEVCGDGLDNDCDGSDNGCTPAGEIALETAWLQILGGTSGLQLGYGLSAPADLDGDGFDDLWIGAIGARSGADETGGALLLSGPLSGTVDATATATAWLLGSADGDGAGRAVAHGDLDGDGVLEALAGAWGDDAEGANAGAVWVQAGPVPGADDAWRVLGPISGSYLGWSLAVGDVNGDGMDDLLTGGPNDSAAASTAGGAWLFYGPLTGNLAATDADTRFYGQAAADQAGATVGLVDLDGDGRVDPAIGAPFQDRGATAAGAIYGITDAPRGDVGLAAATVTWTGVKANDNVRLAASAGDLDGDGWADLVIGAPYARSGLSELGAAYVIYGPATAGGSLSGADATLWGAHDDDLAGLSVTGVGDFDGDGLGDLAIGSHGAAGERGQAALVLGPIWGTVDLATAQVTWLGDAEGDQAGWGAVPAGDLDGDGTDDVLISARLADAEAGAVYGVLGGGL